MDCSCGRQLQPIDGQPITFCTHCDRVPVPSHLVGCGYCRVLAEAFGELAK